MPITSASFLRATILSLAVGFLTVLVIELSALWLAERNDSEADDLIDALTARRESFTVRNLLLDAETGQRGYLLTQDEHYLEPYNEALAGIEKQLAGLRDLARTQPRYAGDIEALARGIADKLSEINETVGLMREGKRDEALAIVRSDRGKNAMDAVRAASDRLVDTTEALVRFYTRELRASASRLLWLLVAGGLVILGVVGATSWVAWRYTRELEFARREVMALNASLEARVEERTSEIAEQRDRAEMLLREVNHRVGNSLALVAALVRLQASLPIEPAVAEALREAQMRINAIARLHKQLYTSDDVRVVAIAPFVAGIASELETTMRAEGSPHEVRVDCDDFVIATDKAVSVGVIVTELLTNAYKYAYPNGGPGEIRVIIRRDGDLARIAVEDDGIGWNGTGKPTGTGLGSQIIGAMASNLRADLSYGTPERGTRVALSFPL